MKKSKTVRRLKYRIAEIKERNKRDRRRGHPAPAVFGRAVVNACEEQLRGA